MSVLAKLNLRKKDKATEIRNLLDLGKKEGRALNAEELKRKEDLYAEVARIDEEIKEEKRFLELATSTSPEERAAGGLTVIRDENDDENGKLRPQFKSLGEQLLAVRAASLPGGGGKVDERLLRIQRAADLTSGVENRSATGSNEAVGADGGFLVQKDISSELLERAVTAGQVSSLVDTMQVSGNGLVINSLQDYDRRDGYQFGGVQAYWTNEAAQMTASRPKFSEMEWKLKDLTAMWYATNNVLEDANSITGVASRAFANVFKFKLDQAYLWGTGTGQPLGIHNSPAMITQTKESGQSNGTILAMNVIKMFSRLHPSARQNAVWLINQDMEPQLYTMFISTGSSSGYPLYTPAGGFNEFPYGTLLGRKVIPIEHAKTLGTQGDITLADMSQYLAITKGGMKNDVSIHVRFEYNETAFRWIVRVDGQPKWVTTLTPTEGSNSQSPFIRLEAR